MIQPVSHLCSEHGVKANCGVETSFTVPKSVTNDSINNPDSVTAGWACPPPGVHADDYSLYYNASYSATAGDNAATCANVDECVDRLSAAGTVDCGQGTTFCGIPPDCGTICFSDDRTDAGAVTVPPHSVFTVTPPPRKFSDFDCDILALISIAYFEEFLTRIKS